MKIYAQLTPEQQTKAFDKAVESILNAICDGAIKFNDKQNHDSLQKHINKAFKEAERLHTPWFAPSIIMEDLYCATRIKSMAQCAAEDNLYSEKNDPPVIDGIA